MSAAPDPWRAARAWCAAEFRKRREHRQHEHASFLANELLEEAIERFELPGHGTAGDASRDGRTGRSFVNVGDPYKTTLRVHTDYWTARFSVGEQH